MNTVCRLTPAFALLGLLVVPPPALAQGFPVAEDPPPGVTITGVGFAPVMAPGRPSERSIRKAVEAADPLALARAVRDARRRAAAIAAVAGVTLGPVASVEIRDALPQFGSPADRCRRQRRHGRPRCRVPALTAGAATVTFSIVDGAVGGDGARLVDAYGTVSAPVDPRRPRDNASIRQTLLAARLAVTPRAAAAAIRTATNAVQAAGLRRAGLVSISEERQSYFYEPVLGFFDPGKFCGIVRRAVRRRNPETGRSRVVRRVRSRRCFFPRPYSLRLEATYEAR